MMQKGLSGFRRFLDVVETEPEIVNAPDAESIDEVNGHVSYENVSFHYSDDDTPVLSNVTFDIPAGKSVALVGPSGSGKTTICSLLPRFYDVTGGRVTIDGKDVRDLTLESLRNQIGLVQQDVYLFCGSIRENICVGRQMRRWKRSLRQQRRLIFMNSSWNFRMGMRHSLVREEPDCPAVRNSAFLLQEYF